MNYRRLGNTGMKVSSVALGAWTTYGQTVEDQQRIQDIIERALELGVNYLDNADVYAKGQGEITMGDALQDIGVQRSSIVLASKVFHRMSDEVNDAGLSRKHIMESIEKSLERLQTDYLDIYFAHRYDPETPLEETVEAFTDLVRSGVVHYWGTSMWTAAQIAEAHTYAKANGLVAPVTEQPEYSMIINERVEQEILPTTERLGVGLVVWSPLAQGLLTGKYDDGIPEDSRFANFDIYRDKFVTEKNIQFVKNLAPIANDLGVTRSQLALAWILRQPGVSSVITGATKVQHIEDNAVAASLELSDDVIAKIEELRGA